MKPFSVPDKRTCVRVLAFVLFFMFAAHAFCFFNLTYSSGSVMLNAAKGSAMQKSGGQYLLPYYWRVRGSLSAPLFVGMLSSVCLTLTALLAAELLNLRSAASLFALCGVLTANSAVTSVFAASLHTADAVFLAQLLAAAGVFLALRARFGALIAPALFAASLALDSGGLSFAAALALLALISKLLRGSDARSVLLAAGKTMLSLAAGTMLYLAGYALLAHVTGMNASASLHLPADSLTAAWLEPVLRLFEPLTAYRRMSVLLRILLAAIAVLCTACALRRLSIRRSVLLIALMLLMPPAVNLPVFAKNAAPQLPLAYFLLDALAIVLADCAKDLLPRAKRVSQAAIGALSVLFLSAVVFSNQVYLKKNLELQSTLSVMTRVIDRIEHTDGYRPGYTPLAIVGNPQDSVLSVPHQGFEHLSALDAAKNNYAVATEEDMTWYLWEVLGYPANLVSTYDLSQFKAREEVKAMSAFPEEGCCVMLDGTLVIKLSE